MVEPYFSSARCNPSDRLNRHGRGGCSYVERQKPGNDFDKVTRRSSDNTPLRRQEGTTDSECLSCSRAGKFISATFGYARSTRFSVSVQKLMSAPRPLRPSWGCKEQRPGGGGGRRSRFAYLREAQRAERAYPRRCRPLLFT